MKTELDNENHYPFYMRVSANDDPIIIEEIIEFMEDVEKYDNYQKLIQDYAKSHFSFATAMKPIFDYIDSEEQSKHT